MDRIDDLGRSIEHYRTSWELTQHQFAERFGFDDRNVRRWENGEVKQPRKGNLQKLEPCLKGREDAMKRRDFFRTALNISLTFPVFCQPSNPDQLRKRLADSLSFEEEFAIIETQIRTCWFLLPHHANVVEPRYLDYVQGYRGILEQWLRNSPRSPVDSRLQSYVSELLQVEGWLFFALGSPHRAEETYKRALQMAEWSKNLRVQALALTWHSNFLIDAGRVSNAFTKAEEARKRAKNADVSPLMRAWINATIADACAYQHEDRRAVSTCKQALDNAVEWMSSVAFEQDGHPAVAYDKTWSFGFRGAVYTHLGCPQDARSELEQGLKLLDPTSYRRWGFHKDLIMAHSLEENVDEACRSARLAMNLARQTNAPMELYRTWEAAHQALKPWKERRTVKDLMAEFQEAEQNFGESARRTAK